MPYFNYHAKIKSLIKGNHLTGVEFYEKWNNINDCYVLFFDNHIPMPVRDYRIDGYINFFKENNIQFDKRIDK